VILRNARVLDGGLHDIRLVDGVIAGVAPTIGVVDEELDLDGRWVVPGLWDEHTHFSQWALASSYHDVSTAGSAAEAASLMRGLTGEPLVGAGFRDGLWPDEPSLAVLDEATGDVPTVLISGDLHCVWLNSAALVRYGHAGHPTGLLVEGDAFAVTHAIGQVADDRLDALAAAAGSAAAARGVVGIVDLEMTWNADTWLRRTAGAFTTQRIEPGVYRQDLDRAIEAGYRTGAPLGPFVTFGRLKLVSDGSLNTRTAYCFDEFPDGGLGMLTEPPASLRPLMRRAADAGIESTVHAIGDHAVSLALDAFEQLGLRGRIEHAQLIADADLPRFAQLGVTASVQPEHALDDRDVADHYWAGRGGRVIPVRALLDADADVVFGSDAPVAPLDPWVTIAAAVTRTRDGREPWHAEQAVSVDEALAASARSRIAVGEPADLVVLDADPSVADLRAMPVAATLLAGRFTHSTL
jgi:predicted amidohydrolase YtcJ